MGLWVLMHGARQHNATALEMRLRNAIVELFEGSDSGEYFDVYTGQHHGASLFSWTSALLIDTVYGDEELRARLDTTGITIGKIIFSIGLGLLLLAVVLCAAHAWRKHKREAHYSALV